MFLSTAAKYIKLTGAVFKFNLMSSLEYRITFLLQVVSTIVNDFALLMIWFLFFKTFSNVNGWDFFHMKLLLVLVTLSFGIISLMFSGMLNLARFIASGELDNYLTLPQNIVWMIAISKTDISAIGDVAFAIGVLCTMSLSLKSFMALGLVIPFVVIIVLSFIITTQSLAFFFGNFEYAANQLFSTLTGLLSYPQTAFSGVLKVLFFTVLPTFFIVKLPIDVITVFSAKSFSILVLFTLAALVLAVTIFNSGLRRYESGNLMNMKM